MLARHNQHCGHYPRDMLEGRGRARHPARGAYPSLQARSQFCRLLSKAAKSRAHSCASAAQAGRHQRASHRSHALAPWLATSARSAPQRQCSRPGRCALPSRYVPARMAYAEGFCPVVCTTCTVGHILPLRQEGRASQGCPQGSKARERAPRQARRCSKPSRQSSPP